LAPHSNDLVATELTQLDFRNRPQRWAACAFGSHDGVELLTRSARDDKKPFLLITPMVQPEEVRDQFHTISTFTPW
jgi:hypothetical protein